MITIGYSTRETNPKYQEYLQKTCMYKQVQIIEKINNGEKSLSQVYNEILNESQYDIVVLCHDDIEFDTNRWGEKLLKLIEKNSDFGIIGVAGTTVLPKSGMWWEDRSKMIGIVNHKHEGKKWESKYSNSLEDKIKNVVIVDGLFIAIDKRKIKENFDESVEGFHMYDVNFCFKNYLEGVNVGVTTSIRLTHLSIGQTNTQWEINKNIFSEKYKDQLPAKIKVTNNDKLKILISCLFFQNFTGSEMYVFELSKNLIKLNCDVTIVATSIEGPLVNMATKLGIKVKHISESPGFKMGDGKWSIMTPQGPIVTKPNQFYKISEVNFDIIHCQHKPVVELMNNLYPTTDKICTIHSEVIDLENPIIHPSIKRYIAIRPEIKQHMIDNFNVNGDIIDVIYNPINTLKFNTENTTKENAILFVGTIDYLRKNTILDLINYTKETNQEFWLIGKNQSDYLNEILKHSHVKYYQDTYEVEKFVKKCSQTAGILLGRTTIEGWLCGKPGWIYNVDSLGNIINKELFSVPDDVDKFKSDVVSEKIKNIYLKIINEI